MAKITITIEEMRAKTREMLGLSEDEDLSFVNEDFINEEAKTIEESMAKNAIPRTVYGSYVAYGYRNGVGPTYEFRGGYPNWATNVDEACAGGRWWLSQSHWNHVFTNRNCGGHPAFSRIAMFTFNK